MSPHLEIALEGHLGIIALDRPAAINALDTGMVETIAGTLAAWADTLERLPACA